MDSSIFVLAGTGGFILLHASQCQPKNTTSIIVANLLSISIGTILFWATGFALALGSDLSPSGNSTNFFVSYTRFLLIDGTDLDFELFTHEVAVVTIVIVLVNAGFVSRMRHWLYPLISILTAGFLYPCARHWTNHRKGWLLDGINVDGKDINYVDLYGSGSIHVFSGAAALIGTVLISPRVDRKGKSFKPVGGNITPLILVGGFLSITGMLVKNTRPNQSIPEHRQSVTLLNNILSAQAAALTSYALKETGFCGDRSKTKALINGALAGLVGMSCNSYYHPYGGFVIGVVSGLAFVSWSSLLQISRIDDPTDTVAVHLGAGFWALLAAPMFLKENGCFYNGEKSTFQTFGWHLLGGVAICVWSGLTYFLCLLIFVVTRTIRYNRKEAVELGLDAYVHDEPAYPDRDQYTQDAEASNFIEDILHKKDTNVTSYHINGTYNHDQDSKPIQPVTLHTRNEQRWRETNY